MPPADSFAAAASAVNPSRTDTRRRSGSTVTTVYPSALLASPITGGALPSPKSTSSPCDAAPLT